ncbi:MAG: hydrogenase maturation protein HypF [Pseudonocardiales bacterium]|nr:hydrogenase maturation protein HypF [Pseudonocardiales bacterium]
MTLTRASTTPAPAVPARVRCRYRVVGLVQGVGFRPFVHATATALGLTGTVANDSAGVVVEAEGDPVAVAALGAALSRDAPPLAVVERVESAAVAPTGGTGFRIAESQRVAGGRTLASADVATCDDCLRELADPGDRRYRHPFITCTNCGPRFTIITDLPYDRPATTMSGFPMCADCAREYADPADRRFHAQPIACPGCGPRLELVDGGARGHGEAALAGARALLAAGAVVAVKGLGGYHLACDATNEDAVATLRRRKARGAKPFAVMVPNLGTARELAVLGDLDAALLTGPRRPVVLVERRPGAWSAPSVSPGNPDLGLLLPYTPVHTLLLGLPGDEPGPRALVMTSGNLAGEPIVTDDADALVRLAGLADAWLRHDRPIRVPCDDSVARVVDGEELPIRRSRGYAPLPVSLPVAIPPTLAVGADLKNTCAVGAGRYAWLSQHVGDMDDLRTLDAFGATQEHLRMLTGVAPTHLVADEHPLYRSTGWARREQGGRVLSGVQHHHAHVASVMAEHGLDGTRPVIGVAFDGTGYGTDGAVWGGEVLVADYTGFERIGHLGYVALPGGDASVRRPYRMAMAHLRAAGVEWTDDLPCVAACPVPEREVLDHQLSTGLGCVPTSSMGRLFDAVSALAGVCQVADHEGQAAVELEGAGRGVPAPDGYRFGEAMDPAPVVRAVAADVRAGVAGAVVSARFHAAVVDLVTGVVATAHAATGLSTVALSGGVFQNPTLLAGVCRALRRNDFTVLRHRVVPPNDGGIALGQLMIAAHRSRGLPCA